MQLSIRNDVLKFLVIHVAKMAGDKKRHVVIFWHFGKLKNSSFFNCSRKIGTNRKVVDRAVKWSTNIGSVDNRELSEKKRSKRSQKITKAWKTLIRPNACWAKTKNSLQMNRLSKSPSQVSKLDLGLISLRCEMQPWLTSRHVKIDPAKPGRWWCGTRLKNENKYF